MPLSWNEIKDRALQALIDSLIKEIDQMVYRLYGLTEE
jgi:hypothetical protein